MVGVELEGAAALIELFAASGAPECDLLLSTHRYAKVLFSV
jgi:hypothetical protein